jgi:predicted NUDIX family phosphoesterase
MDRRMTSDSVTCISTLEQRATEVQRLLDLAPRPFVIEFAGTPKSGKSTSVEAIRHFFSRHGFRVHVLVERASLCPIPMKGHLFFNTWCAATMLAELIANIETDTDLIIVDRGIFDALVWLTLQNQRGEVTDTETKTIEAFLLLDRWRTLIDLAVVMNVSAKEAMERENNQRITSKPGTIMNEEVLGRIVDSVSRTVEKYGTTFGGILTYDTSGENVRESNAKLAGEILARFESFLNPEILVVPRERLLQLPLHNGGAFDHEAKWQLEECIRTSGRPMKRAEAESDPNHVQIIACGILTYKESVFLFQRKERDPKYKLFGKATIWQGTHVRLGVQVAELNILKNALRERISRYLHLSRDFPTTQLGYCWDPTDQSSCNHFGVMFRVSIDNDETAADLRKKEFRTGRGPGLSGGFVAWKGLPGADSNLERWSLSLVNSQNEIQNLKDRV